VVDVDAVVDDEGGAVVVVEVGLDDVVVVEAVVEAVVEGVVDSEVNSAAEAVVDAAVDAVVDRDVVDVGDSSAGGLSGVMTRRAPSGAWPRITAPSLTAMKLSVARPSSPGAIPVVTSVVTVADPSRLPSTATSPRPTVRKAAPNTAMRTRTPRLTPTQTR
jgi:hypothetical protein